MLLTLKVSPATKQDFDAIAQRHGRMTQDVTIRALINLWNRSGESDRWQAVSDAGEVEESTTSSPDTTT